MAGVKEQFYGAIAAVSLLIESATSGKMLAATHMVQAANETGFFAGGVWRGIEGWDGKNNLTGISPAGTIANYPTEADYAAAYMKVMESKGYGYPKVLEEGAQGVRAQLLALGESEWNGNNHYSYGGQVGGKLLQIWSTDASIIGTALKIEAEKQRMMISNATGDQTTKPIEVKQEELIHTTTAESTSFATLTPLEQGLWYLEQMKVILEQIAKQSTSSVQGA